MQITRRDNPIETLRYAKIRPAPIFGPIRCRARFPGRRLTCTLSKFHAGPHVAHSWLKTVAAVWDGKPERSMTDEPAYEDEPAWSRIHFPFLYHYAAAAVCRLDRRGRLPILTF